jgi:hypothetical protein
MGNSQSVPFRDFGTILEQFFAIAAVAGIYRIKVNYS